MKLEKKWFLSIFIFTFVFFSYTNWTVQVNAAAVDKSVADCYEDKKNCQDGNEKVVKQNQTEDQDEQVQANRIDIGFFDVLKMIVSLILVIAILYFLLKFIQKRSQSYQHNKIVQNFGGSSLGGNRSVQIIKVGNRLLVLGIGENIQLLKEIDDEAEIESFIQQHNEQLDQSLQPSTLITKWLNKKQEKGSSFSNDSSPSFQVQLKKQLDEIKKKRTNAMDKLERKESTDE
ncbi:flagellar biosynthetic protein FliO [Bacillus niameyensis]|uniref:flagellar biosynthetic protein FliO n=1 Tax=Bacillus niameyensis TaxID=1522308 RepID=UPI000785B397|nr:flagellar biosynthetic protein FliO [Bacillus niameyensis]